MIKQMLNKAFLVLMRIASDPEDSEEWRLKKMIGAALTLVSIPVNFGYGLLYFAFNERPAAWIMMAATALYAGGSLAYSFRYCSYAAVWAFTSAVFYLLQVMLHVFLGGFAQSGMTLVWLLLLPVVTPVLYTARQGIILFLIVITIFLGVLLLQPYYYRPTNNIPSAVLTTMYVVNLLGAGTYMMLAVYYYVWRNQVLSRMVLNEQEKTDALLLNILPREITTILKNENRVIADHFDGVTILFADVVNFTPLSAKMSPKELVELLNEVFSSFDTLVETHGLEKIKTIGDCYMAAAGAPRRRMDHAKVIARLALDMRDYTRRNTFLGRQLVFRIGVNSGSAVAGVIGRKKFIYDLWGDSVNTASRMESHGAEGVIQITEATYELIKDDFVCEPRGVISVKGKGEMSVWSVVSAKA